MSNIVFKKVPLSVLFNSSRGNSKYTKKYCNAHVGPYEVFTGTTIGKFASISTYDYDGENLTYTTDGEYAGTVDILSGKYNVGGHRAILSALNENIALEYFKYILEPIFKGITKEGSVPSITWSIIKDKEIPVPINEEGKYDLNEQIRIANKYKLLEKQKSKLLAYKDTIKNSLIEANFSSKYNHVEMKITDLFIPFNGGMKYTKLYCNEHKGEYPIYSGSTKKEFAFIDSYDYKGKYITWCIDGLAGYIKVLDGKFSITNHRGILVAKDSNVAKSLDMEYLKYVIEPIFRKNIKGRMGHDGQNEYTSLKLNAVNKIQQKISIPIKENGKFDLEAQKEIARKYKKIDEVKREICDKIDILVNSNIILE
ncbi:restriction endonuclease subunit S [Clostridium perfringens]